MKLNRFLLFLFLLLLSGTNVFPAADSSASANSIRKNLTVDLGGDICIIQLGGMSEFGWDAGIGLGYSVDKIGLHCYADHYSANYKAVLSGRTYRESITMPCVSVEYRISKIYPFIFAGLGTGNFEIQTGQNHLDARKTAWGLGGGFKYGMASLGVRYFGPVVQLEGTDTSLSIPITAYYSMNGDFQLFLGLTFKMNMFGKLIF